MQSTSTIWQTENQQKPQEEQDELGLKFTGTFDGHTYEVYPVLESIPNKWWLTLWEMYQTSLNIEDAIQEQRVYTLQQFFEVMIDHKYKKSLVLQDGLPMGLMFGTTSLEKMRLNGVNPDALGRRFPEATSQKRLFYLMVIYFSPELRSFGFYNWYLPLVVFPIADLCDVFVADFCDARSSLIVVLEACIKEAGLPFGHRQVFGTQTYGGFIREGS